MTKPEGLIESVIEQIVIDIQNSDYTALVEMLEHVPEKYLIGFLSDVQGENK